MEYALYQSVAEKYNRGIFFYTSCCNNTMYSIDNDSMLYHGKLCPKCYHKGRAVILYYVGTEDALEQKEAGKLIEFGDK